FGVIHGLEAVEPDSDPASFAADLVAVPVVRLQHFLYLGRVRLRQEGVAAGFIVEAAPEGVAHVRLVAGDFVRWVGDSPAAKLNAAVDEAAPDELDLQAEVEVGVAPGRAQEFAVR